MPKQQICLKSVVCGFFGVICGFGGVTKKIFIPPSSMIDESSYSMRIIQISGMMRRLDFYVTFAKRISFAYDLNE